MTPARERRARKILSLVASCLLALSVALLIALQGCKVLHPQWPEDPWRIREGPARVEGDHRIDRAREPRLRLALRAHQHAFRVVFGPIPEHDVAIVDDEARCGLTMEKRYWGCTIGRTILLTSGGPPNGRAQGVPADSLPSYTHEMFHLIVPEDLDHRDRRWPEVDKLGTEVWRGLK